MLINLDLRGLKISEVNGNHCKIHFDAIHSVTHNNTLGVFTNFVFYRLSVRPRFYPMLSDDESKDGGHAKPS